MRRAIQGALLRGYSALRSSGLLDTSLGRSATRRAYSLYKRWLEREADQLRRYVAPGTWVVDVGANVGFFTLKFARWVSPPGRVVALEPEPDNCAALAREVRRAGLGARVEIVQAAAAEIAGPLRLALNPDNPADHRLGASGIPVRALRLDDLLSSLGDPAVSLVKIDVQGAEGRVLAGARETLRRHRPHLFVEIDDAALRAAGCSADEIIETLASYGYCMHALERGGARPVSRDEARERCRELGYADFLFARRDG